jgi:4-diphosphocytidyl-2-C-methyl-D-erythritol kinase
MDTFFAPAKLNLFLHVNGRRADGYHLLESLFILLDQGDTLTIRVRDDGQINRVNDVPNVPPEMDLAVRSAISLKNASNTLLGADIAVLKRTPMGAGLGGGSSDAATVLLALNKLWGCGFSNAKLQEIGLKLGADVPFFVFGQSAFAQGIGEKLTAVHVPQWWYVVLTPDVHVPTPFVFSQPDLTRTTPSLKIADFSATIDAKLFLESKNDLQGVVLKAFPAVAVSLAALSEVSKKSVFGARMTGSGASVFAAFETEHDAREAFLQLSPKYTGFVARGLDKHPYLLQFGMQDSVASGR